MRRFWSSIHVLGLAGAVSACGDSAGAKAPVPDFGLRDGGAPTADAAVPTDTAPPSADGAPTPDAAVVSPDGSAAFDAAVVSPPDASTAPDATGCAFAPTAVPTLGGAGPLPGGEGGLTDADLGVYWHVRVLDPEGMRLDGATASLVASGAGFTLLVHRPGYLAAVLSAPLSAGSYGVNAGRQATEGPGAKEVFEAPVETSPCAGGRVQVEVLAVLAPLDRVVTRQVLGDALADRCEGAQAPADAPLCAYYTAIHDDLSGLPARLQLASDSHPQYHDAGVALLAGPGMAALERDTCGTPWGVVPLAWLDDQNDQDPTVAPLARWRALSERLGRQILAESDPNVAPPPPGTFARRTRLGMALAWLSGVVAPTRFDLVGTTETPAFPDDSTLMHAAEAVRRVIASNDVPDPRVLGIPRPLQGLLFDGPVPALDALSYAVGFQGANAYGLGPAADCALAEMGHVLSFDDAFDAPAREVIEAMLTVLEAVPLGDAQPPSPDAGVQPPPADAGVRPPIDAGAFADATPPNDAGPAPDAGAVVPGGPCADDDSEPNGTWQNEVLDGQRLPRNVSHLSGRTLMPGDEDWYDFEADALNLNLGATVSADGSCDTPGGTLCAELLWFTWVNAEGLGDPDPISLVGPMCGDLHAPIALNAGGVAGLAGEPWTSVLVHVWRDPASPPDAAFSYQVGVTR